MSGILLKSDWTLRLDVMSQGMPPFATAETAMSPVTVVTLCPHKEMDYWVTSDQLLKAINLFRNQHADPLESSPTGSGHSRAKRSVRSVIRSTNGAWDIGSGQITEESIRHLGKGKSARDPIWASTVRSSVALW